jgi:predicted PurR-regulated permease PerM
MVGQLLENYWQRLAASGDSLATLSKGLLGPLRNFLIAAGKATGEGLLQLTLASFIGFFIYRDGDRYLSALRTVLNQIAGGRGDEFLQTIDASVSGAVNGIFGTALAQALVAMTGFVIAGVPGAFMLSVAVFFLSVVPIGPPLVWGGATVWLVYQGQTGWAVFMALWGVLGISAIDNLVKPYLISRRSNLPLLLTVLGMLGGVVAFGFIGVFIGPPVLAIGLTLLQLWIARRAENSDVQHDDVAGVAVRQH